MDALERNGSPSVGELVGDLARETRTLVRQEMRLATVETTEKLGYAVRQGAYLGVGGVIGLVALHALAATIALALGLVMPLWAGALIVGGCLAIGAALLVWKGVHALREMDLRPEKTLQAFEDTKSWAKHQLQ